MHGQGAPVLSSRRPGPGRWGPQTRNKDQPSRGRGPTAAVAALRSGRRQDARAEIGADCLRRDDPTFALFTNSPRATPSNSWLRRRPAASYGSRSGAPSGPRPGTITRSDLHGEAGCRQTTPHPTRRSFLRQQRSGPLGTGERFIPRRRGRALPARWTAGQRALRQQSVGPRPGASRHRVVDLGFCSPEWTRTTNPAINSRMLCQLSYGG
jgi:hypothetical protein